MFHGFPLGSLGGRGHVMRGVRSRVADVAMRSTGDFPAIFRQLEKAPERVRVNASTSTGLIVPIGSLADGGPGRGREP